MKKLANALSLDGNSNIPKRSIGAKNIAKEREVCAVLKIPWACGWQVLRYLFYIKMSGGELPSACPTKFSASQGRGGMPSPSTHHHCQQHHHHCQPHHHHQIITTIIIVIIVTVHIIIAIVLTQNRHMGFPGSLHYDKMWLGLKLFATKDESSSPPAIFITANPIIRVFLGISSSDTNKWR